MIDQLKTMPIEEFRSILDGLGLVDAIEGAKIAGVKPASMRNPNGRYKKIAVKIGQYWFWRREELMRITGQMYSSIAEAEADGWVFPGKKVLKTIKRSPYRLAHIKRQGKKICVVSANGSLWTRNRIVATLGHCREVWLAAESINHHPTVRVVIERDVLERILATADDEVNKIYERWCESPNNANPHDGTSPSD